MGDSLAQVDNFFTDNVLYLGAMPSTLNDLTFTLSDTMTNLSGFGVNFAFAEVPEPSTWLIFGAGLLGFGLYGIRRRRRETFGPVQDAEGRTEGANRLAA